MDDRDPRVFLAIERTFLAWTRTALALMGFGFVVARLGLFIGDAEIGSAVVREGNLSGSIVVGVLLILLGLLVQLGATYEHRGRIRSFEHGGSITPMGRSFGTVVAALVVGVGLVSAAYLWLIGGS